MFLFLELFLDEPAMVLRYAKQINILEDLWSQLIGWSYVKIWLCDKPGNQILFRLALYFRPKWEQSRESGPAYLICWYFLSLKQIHLLQFNLILECWWYESQSWSITELKPSSQLLNLKVEWIDLTLKNDGTWKNL